MFILSKDTFEGVTEPIQKIMQGRPLRVLASFDSSLASKPVELKIKGYRDPLLDVTNHFSFTKLTTNVRTADCKAEWIIIPKETSSGFSSHDTLQLCVEVWYAEKFSILVNWGPFIVIKQTDLRPNRNVLGMFHPPPPSLSPNLCNLNEYFIFRDVF